MASFTLEFTEPKYIVLDDETRLLFDQMEQARHLADVYNLWIICDEALAAEGKKVEHG